MTKKSHLLPFPQEVIFPLPSKKPPKIQNKDIHTRAHTTQTLPQALLPHADPNNKRSHPEMAQTGCSSAEVTYQ